MDDNKENEPVIGTLNEHTLHLALKNYFEPDPQYHEKRICGFVADICRPDGITEIETVSFSNLKKKLGAFLSAYPVNAVYPIAVKKWIVNIDTETGEMSEKRKSPKKGRPCDVFTELYKIREYLSNENFTLTLVLCETVDYKRRKTGKRGRYCSFREERIPVGFEGKLTYRKPGDYALLADVIPDGEFTSAQFGKANKMRKHDVWFALKTLCTVGVIGQCGKKGNAILYKRLENTV